MGADFVQVQGNSKTTDRLVKDSSYCGCAAPGGVATAGIAAVVSVTATTGGAATIGIPVSAGGVLGYQGNALGQA